MGAGGRLVTTGCSGGLPWTEDTVFGAAADEPVGGTADDATGGAAEDADTVLAAGTVASEVAAESLVAAVVAPAGPDSTELGARSRFPAAAAD